MQKASYLFSKWSNFTYSMGKRMCSIFFFVLCCSSFFSLFFCSKKVDTRRVEERKKGNKKRKRRFLRQNPHIYFIHSQCRFIGTSTFTHCTRTHVPICRSQHNRKFFKKKPEKERKKIDPNFISINEYQYQLKQFFYCSSSNIKFQ